MYTVRFCGEEPDLVGDSNGWSLSERYGDVGVAAKLWHADVSSTLWRTNKNISVSVLNELISESFYSSFESAIALTISESNEYICDMKKCTYLRSFLILIKHSELLWMEFEKNNFEMWFLNCFGSLYLCIPFSHLSPSLPVGQIQK